MKKPQPIVSNLLMSDFDNGFRFGYNIAYDNWEKFLPDVEELSKIIADFYYPDHKVPYDDARRFINLSKLIAKRIGKEE